MRTLTVSFFIFLSSGLASAATWNVPGDFPTIQAAIQGASHGDLILVAPGTYTENIQFLGKSVEVASISGASQTVIEASGPGSVVSFIQNEGRGSILRGFTIQNGSGTSLGGQDTFGGGIYAADASPTLEDNVITQNTARGNIFFPGGSGGGLYLQNSSALLRGNTLQSNSAQDDGGALYASSTGSLEILDNVIESNSALGCGSGICVFGSTVIRNNEVRGNFVATDGGGIHCGGGAVIEDNIIESNSATNAGGGIFAPGAVTIQRNTIDGNVAGLIFGMGGGIYCNGNAQIVGNTLIRNRAAAAVADGGGIFCAGGSPIIASNMIVNNTASAGGATAQGGGLAFYGGNSVLVHNTIANNQSTNFGGGLYMTSSASVTMGNSIVWGNTAPTDPQISSPGGLVITYSDIEGGWAGIGNIDQDPLFANPGSSDYHLSIGSPCFDRGDDSNPNNPAEDFEGDNRLHHRHVDMGADEISACLVLMEEIGQGLGGSGGFVPHLYGIEGSCEAGGHSIHVEDALGGAQATLWIGLNSSVTPAFGGEIYIDLGSPFFLFNLTMQGPTGVPGAGFLNIPGGDVSPFDDLSLILQFTILDPGAPSNVAITNGLTLLITD